ncbi:MAG: helicase-related protein, partial [Chloroflexota bacterium]
AGDILKDPVKVSVAPQGTTVEKVNQQVLFVEQARKRALLAELFDDNAFKRVLVFTRTKRGANHLAEQLQRDGIAATAIHGNKSQGQRVRALDDFKAGRARILVATEVASRGLDIEDLPHVVNFELPMVAEDYVHRIGRTGRAGATGDAISLVCVDEQGLLREIEALLRQRIRSEVIAGFEPDRSIRPEPIRRGGQGGRPGGARVQRPSSIKAGAGGPWQGPRPGPRPARGHGGSRRPHGAVGFGNSPVAPASPGDKGPRPGRQAPHAARSGGGHGRRHPAMPGERFQPPAGSR